MGEQCGRERQQRHHEQEPEIDPGKGPVAAAQDAQQGVLGKPEGAQHREAQQIRRETRAQCQQRLPQPALGVHRTGGADRHPHIQDQQRHGDGEHPIAQRGQALAALPAKQVVRLGHALIIAAP